MNHLPAAREFLNAANKALAEVIVTGRPRDAISRAESNIDAAHGALSRAIHESGWQSMETAPKGVDVIGLFADGTVRGMWYFAPSSRTFGWCAVGLPAHKAKPSHWMPRPAAPVQPAT